MRHSASIFVIAMAVFTALDTAKTASAGNGILSNPMCKSCRSASCDGSGCDSSCGCQLPRLDSQLFDPGCCETPQCRESCVEEEAFICEPHRVPNLPSSTLLQYFRSDNTYTNIWDGFAAERQKRYRHTRKHITGNCDCASKSHQHNHAPLDDALLRGGCCDCKNPCNCAKARLCKKSLQISLKPRCKPLDNGLLRAQTQCCDSSCDGCDGTY